ncbi:MAG TPA: DUF1116 domain-containing protein [Polyangiaceae bacterium]|jgi:hypothetical protein|nr:MAG: hypothetical protein BWY17_02548 [Deltaproteobacteria bacterium ADurb.Bin207]HNS95510.1 DUF1116 domain-containing protein [Polyangiaceae bacterium]HNZ23601.1 DUF1116 domain-containing protein [Polyangiaceae bacterium]HOD22701.1 DUF1116 domain-containing protein [Polyangiaceae bacterium]HOE47747.1 DUF1116 domain-containing protein [Polyangiaceae bacterium]
MADRSIVDLFGKNLSLINLGLPSFGKDLADQGVSVVDASWQPPAAGDTKTIEALTRFMAWPEAAHRKVNEANALAVKTLREAQPVILDVRTARDVVPGMHDKLVLHAGPPVTWERMCGPMRGGVIGGLLYEGLASTREEAEKLAASGEITFEPCHHHASVGPMAGIMTASMPVWIIENKTFSNRAYCTLNEGLGKVLRYGAFSEEVLTRLRWMRDELAPALSTALAASGPIDLRTVIAQALQMGDEGHNRNRAGTSLVFRLLAPHLVDSALPREVVARVLRFLDGNDHFFLNLTMPACKSAVEPIRDIPFSTVISTMARNGTDFGVRLAGLVDRWFTAPASKVDGLYLPGFSADDAALDIGDSVITETAGIGGFAMAAAPAIVRFVGGSAADALRVSKRMYEISLGEHPVYQIPALDFRGTPTGIDVRAVVEKNVLPAVNTGIAHKEPGIGMVGAGLVVPPVACFRQAFQTFVSVYEEQAKALG